MTLIVRDERQNATLVDYSWPNEKAKKPERHTVPELLPRLSIVPRQSHDPLGVDLQHCTSNAGELR